MNQPQAQISTDTTAIRPLIDLESSAKPEENKDISNLMKELQI